MAKDYLLYINGAWTPAQSGETFDSINPATGEVIGHFARGQSADIDRAVQAARKAFDDGPWPRMTGEERGDLIKALADQLADKTKALAPLEMADSGSTYKKVQGDFWVAVNNLKYFSKLARNPFEGALEGAGKPGTSHHLLRREPLGVCGQIIPWNFPLMMAVWKLGPALAAGCTLVLKPAEETPVIAMELAAMIHELGFPPGVVNVVTGYGHEAGAALVAHPGVDKIAFTGSTEIGKKVMAEAACDMKRVTLECGGKSANIVLDDADLDIAIDGILYGAFFHNGQCCTAGTRLLLPASQKDTIVAKLLERAKGIVTGLPSDRAADLGPVISEKQLNRILSYIEKGKAEGATLLMGGERLTAGDLAQGYFVAPTIFDNVTNDMTIAREEIFGPVLSILTYNDDADAVKIANDSPYGLAGAVWSRNEDRALSVARQLRTGTVWINEYHLVSERAPFGGFKQSGLGRELGPSALDAYTEVKHIHVDELGDREKKFWYDVLLRPQNLAAQ